MYMHVHINNSKYICINLFRSIISLYRHLTHPHVVHSNIFFVLKSLFLLFVIYLILVFLYNNFTTLRDIVSPTKIPWPFFLSPTVSIHLQNCFGKPLLHQEYTFPNVVPYKATEFCSVITTCIFFPGSSFL